MNLSSNEMKIKKMHIDPILAKHILGFHDGKNRSTSNGTVNSYARDMKNRKWELSSATIAFDTDGDLMDGKHRILAVLQSNTAIDVIAVLGLKRNRIMETIDRGRPRTVAGALQAVDGEKHANVVAAIANRIAYLVEGDTVRLTTGLARYIIKLYREEINSILENMIIVRYLTLTPVLAAFVIGAKVDMEKTIEFENKYFLGEGLVRDEPAYKLRNHLLTSNRYELQSSRKGTVRIAMNMLKYHIEGKKIARIVKKDYSFPWFAERQEKEINAIKKYLSINGM